jgi:hypothetical protein
MHAINETKWMLQYSLSHVLFSAGVSVQTALLIGQIWYVIMIVIGLWLARAMVIRRHPEGIVLAPSSSAALGGSFVHLWQMSIAAPLGALFAKEPGSRTASFAAWGVLLLSSPWIDVGYPIPGALCVLATFTIGRLLLRWAWPICLGSMVCVAMLAFAVAHTGPMLSSRSVPAAAQTSGVAAAHPLAIVDAPHEILAFALKIPSWAGLACILIAVASSTMRASSIGERID